MQGFKPHIARQHLADGGPVGFIGRAKQLLGMDEERNKRIAAYKAGQAAPAPAPAASAPAAPAAPATAPAVTDYSGMGAAQRREKAQGLANGGMVRGPGTGTSDDIPADLPVGSYIMPADSTKAIGADALDSMGGGNRRGFNPARAQKVKAQISNGEYNLTPEKVHAIGIETLDAMKGETHTPVRGGAQGAAAPDESNRAFFAKGGAVTPEEAERLRLQTQMYVQGAQAAQQPAAPGLDQRVAQIPAGAPTPAGPPVVAGGRPAPAAGGSTFVNPLPNTTAVARGASEDASAAWNAGNPAQAVGAAVRGAITTPITAVGESAYNVVAPWGRGISSFARGLTGAQADPAAQQPQSVATPTAPRPTSPTAAPTVAAPVSAPMAVKSAAASSDLVPSSPGAAPAAPGATEVMPGVFRSGNSYGDSAGAAVSGPTGNTGQPSAQNDLAASNLAARGFNPAAAQAAMAAPAGVPAPIVRNSTNDWALRKEIDNARTAASSITNTRRWGGRNPSNADALELEALLRADTTARGAQPGLDQEGMRQAGSLQREGIQQQGNLTRERIQQGGANTRANMGFQTDRARIAVEASRAASENAQRGVATAGAQQVQQLRNVLLDPNSTAEQRKQAETSLQSLSPRGAQADWRVQVTPAVKNADGSTTEGSVIRYNQATGEVQRVPQGAAQGQQAGPVTGQVYTDAKGNRARWDGTKYVPV